MYERSGTRSYDFANGAAVTYTGTAGLSAAFAGNGAAVALGLVEVALCATSDCWIKVGTAPTATAAAGSMFVPSLTIFHIRISPGDKISVVQNSAGGTLSIVPVAS